MAAPEFVAPWTNPVRWLFARLALYGAVILTGMLIFAVAVSLYYAFPSRPQEENPPAPIEGHPEPRSTPTEPRLEYYGPNEREQFISRLDELFVGVPVFSEGKRIGVVKRILGEGGGVIGSVEIELSDQAPEKAERLIVPFASIEWSSAGDTRWGRTVTHTSIQDKLGPKMMALPERPERGAIRDASLLNK